VGFQRVSLNKLNKPSGQAWLNNTSLSDIQRFVQSTIWDFRENEIELSILPSSKDVRDKVKNTGVF
jgi:hypothetical protein